MNLKLGFDAMTINVGYISTNADITNLAGDFTKNHLDTFVPPSIRQILRLKDVERVVVYPKRPQLIEIIRTKDASIWHPTVGEIMHILAEEFNPGQSFERVEMGELCPEFTLARAT